MTNAEYNDFAKKVLEDIFSDDNPNTQSTNITNIGEIFALKIIEGIANLNENTFPYRGADKVNNTIISLLNKRIDNSEENFGELPTSHITDMFIGYHIFFGIRLAINTHSNPEYMLQRLGVEDVQSLISKVNDVDNTDNAEEAFNLIVEIYNHFCSYIDNDKLFRLSFWGIISYFGRNIISHLKNVPLKEIIHSLKYAKYTGVKYHSIYKERMLIIQNKVNSFSHENGNLEDFLPQDIIDLFINYGNKFISLKDVDDAVYEEFGNKYYFLALDFLFVLYYFIYEAPQHIVKLGFYLMSDMISANISGAIIPSFQKQDYAGLIQYEYEWWCKETGERLSLLFPFFEGQLDLSKINIVDYDLDKKKAPLQIIVKNDNLSYIDSESPDKDTEQHFGLALKSSEVEYLYNELKGTFLDANTDIRLFCYRLTGKGKPDKIENLKWIVDDKSLGVFIQTLGVSKEKCWKKTESFFGTKTNNIKASYSRNTDPKGILQTNETNSNRIYDIVKKIL